MPNVPLQVRPNGKTRPTIHLVYSAEMPIAGQTRHPACPFGDCSAVTLPKVPTQPSSFSHWKLQLPLQLLNLLLDTLGPPEVLRVLREGTRKAIEKQKTPFSTVSEEKNWSSIPRLSPRKFQTVSPRHQKKV